MNQQRSAGSSLRCARGQASNRHRGQRRGEASTQRLPARTGNGQAANQPSPAQKVMLDQRPPQYRKPRQFSHQQQMHIMSIGRSMEEKLSPILRHTVFPRDFVRSVLVPAMPSTMTWGDRQRLQRYDEKAAILMAGVLLSAAKRKGPAEIGELWRKSGLQWTQFLISYRGVDDFIKKHKLEFTLAPEDVNTPIKSPPNVGSPMKKKEEESEHARKVRLTLARLLVASVSNELIFRWIDANVVERKEATFIRTLVTEVLKSAIDRLKQPYKLDTSKLRSRMPLLSRYIAHDENLELQALFAVQSLSHQLGLHGLLRQIFDVIYDDGVITKESFQLWRYNCHLFESEGKERAEFFTTSFFSRLEETESYNDNDEDDCVNFDSDDDY